MLIFGRRRLLCSWFNQYCLHVKLKLFGSLSVGVIMIACLRVFMRVNSFGLSGDEFFGLVLHRIVVMESIVVV